MPFINYFEKENLDYLCFYEGELDTKIKNNRIKQGNFLKSFKAINETKNSNDEIYLITGTFMNFLKSMIIKRFISAKTHLIFRTRGIVPEESYLRNKSNLRFKILSCIEKYCLKKSNFILTVSKFQMEHYVKKYNIKRDKIFVVHNFLNHWQYKMRSISKKDIPSIVYVGSYNKWQRVDDILKLFKKIKEKIGNVKFIVCTQKDHIEIFSRLAKENNIHVQVESHDYNNLINRISSMTTGIIMRSESIVNKVSSPFKIIDYISSGTPFIMTNNIGDYSSIFKGADFVNIINDKESYSEEDVDTIIEFINKNLDRNNDEIIRFAKENLDFSKEMNQVTFLKEEIACK